MEDPGMWGKAEHVVSEVLDKVNINRALPPSEQIIGFSVPRQITNALREAGLLLEEDEPLGDVLRDWDSGEPVITASTRRRLTWYKWLRL